MNDKSQATTALKAVQEETGRRLRQVERRISEQTNRMNEKFLFFFDSGLEEMYKAQRLRTFLTSLSKQLDDCEGLSGSELSELFLSIANRKTSEIARGSLSKCSTSRTANLAYQFNLEAVQEMITISESLAFVANHYSEL